MTDEMWRSSMMLPDLCGGAEAPPSPTNTRPGCSSGTGPPNEHETTQGFVDIPLSYAEGAILIPQELQVTQTIDSCQRRFRLVAHAHINTT